MKIEAKYDLGAKLFYLNEDKKIKQESVTNIAIFVRKDDVAISYTMKEPFTGSLVKENHLFETKEDLIASLDDTDEES